MKCVWFFFYLENGLKPEEPIENENPPRNYPDLSETDVVEDDCRDGCKDKDYFYDYLTEKNGQMKIRNQAREAGPEILNPLNLHNNEILFKGMTIPSVLTTMTVIKDQDLNQNFCPSI